MSPEAKRRAEIRKKKEGLRSKANYEWYDREWQIYRHRFLHYNPKCYACGVDATVVDHVLAARVDRERLFWKADNHIPLCKKCHDTVTGLYDRKDPPDLEGKLQWLDNSRKINGVSVRVKVIGSGRS
jgi:5-methylcytosine-specific restriction endonuclease McrA